MLHFSYICLIFTLQNVMSQEAIVLVNKINFCFNSEHRGFRLNATILYKVLTSNKISCVVRCVHGRCCRSVNYKYNVGPTGECELLKEKGIDSSGGLQKNEAFHHLYLLEPDKDLYPNCSDADKIPEIHAEKPKDTYISCKRALENDSSLVNGVYHLQRDITSPSYSVYCHMTNLGVCRGGGWTLVMKLDGSKDTFEYNSKFWTNNETLNEEHGAKGLNEVETKLSSYSNTPFTKLCVGMKLDNVTNWLEVDYGEADSLYSLIQDGVRRNTFVGRDKWKSLIKESSLQLNCNEEGFNLHQWATFLRLGIVGNNERNCFTPDSLLGIGIWIKQRCTRYSSPFYLWSSGNVATCKSDNRNKAIPTFGYIFVR